jgi:GNAT superfamily N-acetyltransferase
MKRGVGDVWREGPLCTLERFYDAIARRHARAEELGAFVSFVRTGTGQPYYARPTLAASLCITAADIASVRARQRELGEPEAFEWVHETTPALLAMAEAAGLCVARNPLMLLEAAALPVAPLREADGLRLLQAADPALGADLAVIHAVTSIGFGVRRPRSEAPGVTRQDVALTPVAAEEVARVALSIQCGQAAYAISESPRAGALASGAYQRIDEVAEIVGVATLPVARRQGRGSAITAALAREALSTGAKMIFLSAANEETARMYARLGFRRIGTACVATPRAFQPPFFAAAS